MTSRGFSCTRRRSQSTRKTSKDKMVYNVNRVEEEQDQQE